MANESTKWPRLHKCYCTCRDSIFEALPSPLKAIKPWYGLFEDEVSGVKHGWVLFAVLATLLCVATGWVTHSVMEKKISTSHEIKMVKKPSSDALFDEYKDNASELFNQTAIEFDKGEYSYCILFYERALDLSDGRFMVQVTPLYAMAKFSESPTQEGSQQFHKQLTSMVEILKKSSITEGELEVVIVNLNKSRTFIDAPEKLFVDQIVNEVIKIKKRNAG